MEQIYDKIQTLILEKLNSGIIPWKIPWNYSLPSNFVTKKEYRGINLLMLFFNNYKFSYYLTFNRIKKGEKGHLVVYWNFIEREDKNNPNKKVKIPFLKYYYVWNLEQMENYDILQLENKNKELVDKNLIFNDEVDKFIKNWEVEIIEYNGGACYNFLKDKIFIPFKNNFVDVDSYYSTVFHEMIHSTGYKDRLNRKLTSHSKNEEYSFEELIAEIGAAFLNAKFGINNIEQNAAYIQAWIKYLKESPKKTILTASSMAQKAIDYIIKGKIDSTDEEIINE